MITAHVHPAAAPPLQSVSALELAFILYTSFGVGWFFNNFISFDVGKYIFANYAQLAVFTCWWCLLVLRKQAVKPLVIPVTLVLAGILAIESYHVWRVGVGRGNVTGVKAILYSPLYAPLINLVVFSLILHEYRTRRIEVIKTVVAVAASLTVLGMLLWFLVFSGAIRPIETDSSALVQILNNNAGAYVSCFVLYCVNLTSLRGHLSRRRRLVYTAIAATSILLYTSRGAILVMAAYAFLVAFRRVSFAKFVGGVALAGTIAALAIVAMRTETAAEYYRVFATISRYMSDLKEVVGPFLTFKDIELTDLTRQHPSDPLISAVGRVFSGLIALQVFREHAMLGVGTYTAYSIEAYGTGIHSLPFLYAASSGLVGIALLLLLFRLIADRRLSVARHHILYLLPVGLFLNSFPAWYACCFFLGRADEESEDARDPELADGADA
jgi:hypothetical protein